MANSREVGKLGEGYARSYLINYGYEILYSNYRTKLGEIDIIAKYGSYIIFVEVKYRKSMVYGYPKEFVNKKKQQKIKNVALFFIANQNIENMNFRFDVIEVFGDMGINHIKDAFWT